MYGIGDKGRGGLVSFFSEYGDGSGRSLPGKNVLLRLHERTGGFWQPQYGTCGYVQQLRGGRR